MNTACLTEAGHLSTTTAATEYSHQPKLESHDDQSRDTGETSPTPTKWDTLLDEFADVFTEPTQPHPRPIQHRIELLDPTKPIPNHKQYQLGQKELEEAKKQIDDLLSKGWI